MKYIRTNNIIIAMSITFIFTIIYINHFNTLAFNKEELLLLSFKNLLQLNYEVAGDISITNTNINRDINIPFNGKINNKKGRNRLDFNIGLDELIIQENILTYYNDNKMIVFETDIDDLGTVYFSKEKIKLKRHDSINSLFKKSKNVINKKNKKAITIQKGTYSYIKIMTNCFHIPINNNGINRIIENTNLKTNNNKYISYIKKANINGNIYLYIDNDRYLRKINGKIKFNNYTIELDIQFRNFKGNIDIVPVDYSYGNDITNLVRELF